MRSTNIFKLNESPYIVEINGYKYVFSSDINKDKFIHRFRETIDKISHFMSTKWGFIIIENNLGILLSYLRIEHRGCRIILPDGSEITEWEEIMYKDGNIMKNV